MNEKSLIERIQVSLDSIRPYLNADGGDIEIIEVTEANVLKVKLLGACENCKMSYQTMQAGVEEVVMKAVPEITGIEAINQLLQK